MKVVFETLEEPYTIGYDNPISLSRYRIIGHVKLLAVPYG